MLDLLIGIFMTVGVQYTQLDDGKIAISASDAVRLEGSLEFQRNLDILPLEAIVIADEVDPNSSSDSNH